MPVEELKQKVAPKSIVVCIHCDKCRPHTWNGYHDDKVREVSLPETHFDYKCDMDGERLQETLLLNGEPPKGCPLQMEHEMFFEHWKHASITEWHSKRLWKQWNKEKV